MSSIPLPRLPVYPLGLEWPKHERASGGGAIRPFFWGVVGGRGRWPATDDVDDGETEGDRSY